MFNQPLASASASVAGVFLAKLHQWLSPCARKEAEHVTAIRVAHATRVFVSATCRTVLCASECVWRVAKYRRRVARASLDIGGASVKLFLPIFKMNFPEIVDSALPAEGVFQNLVFVSIRKTYPMQAYRIMHGLWGMGQMMFTKYLVVVDDECLRTATRRA
jgi:hypothetical protein